MHGKSGCFALQKSRFRNAKTKLPFFFGIIFTGLRVFSSCLLELLGNIEELEPYASLPSFRCQKRNTPHLTHSHHQPYT
ncbi:hypothetical protein CLI69_09715 [Prevotella intermedia]|nr:hypothetical protein CLI69_09715 [Prevotella intermedia]